MRCGTRGTHPFRTTVASYFDRHDPMHAHRPLRTLRRARGSEELRVVAEVLLPASFRRAAWRAQVNEPGIPHDCPHRTRPTPSPGSVSSALCLGAWQGQGIERPGRVAYRPALEDAGSKPGDNPWW
jgi:hypothetical protein